MPRCPAFFSLNKRFKDDVREVTNNHECGLVMDFSEVQEGDVVVAYQQVEEKATL